MNKYNKRLNKIGFCDRIKEMYRVFLKWRMVRHMYNYPKTTNFVAINLRKSEDRKKDKALNKWYNLDARDRGLTNEEFFDHEKHNRKFRMPIRLEFPLLRKIFGGNETILDKLQHQRLDSIWHSCLNSKYFINKNLKSEVIYYVVSDEGENFMSPSGLIEEIGHKPTNNRPVPQ